MARVPLTPIGSPRDAFLDRATFDKNKAQLAEREAELAKRRAKVAEGWARPTPRASTRSRS